LKDIALGIVDRAQLVATDQRVALADAKHWLEPLFGGSASKVARELIAPILVAARVTREPLVLLVPMLAAEVGYGPSRIIDQRPPETAYVGDLPTYALDKHTRIGRTAIRRFAASNVAVKNVLACVAPAQRAGAAYMAAFYTDAAPLARKRVWAHLEQLEGLAIEADLLKSGVRQELQPNLLAAFAENLPELNGLRSEAYLDAQRAHLADEGLLV
jgi:hypothetical protein